VLEDLRKVCLKIKLRQLTNEQLQKIWYHPEEPPLDLEENLVEPNNIVLRLLAKIGFKKYETRSIKGKFYTTERKKDLAIATGEILKERLQHNMLESARYVARNHKRCDPKTQHIFLSPYNEYIRLVEVTPDVSTSGDVFPVRFYERPDWNVYYQTCIILLSTEEWEMVQDGRLKLPDGWDKDTLQSLI